MLFIFAIHTMKNKGESFLWQPRQIAGRCSDICITTRLRILLRGINKFLALIGANTYN